MNKKKELLVRSCILLVGLLIAHAGVALFLLVGLGTDPFNVLVQGVSQFLSNQNWGFTLSHGSVHRIICLLIILVLLVVDRSYVKVGTIVCMLCGGPFIDLFNVLFSPWVSESLPLVLRLLITAAACCILAFGMTIVIKSDAGTGPNDLVSIVISDKIHKRFGIVRLVTDAAFVFIGFFLNASIGLGTLVCVVLVGPVADFFLPVSGKMVDRLLNQNKIKKFLGKDYESVSNAQSGGAA